MKDQFSISVQVNASQLKLWESLTVPHLMMKWMAEPETKLEIITDWKPGNPILIKGFHHVKFENRGIVLAFEPMKKMSFTHLSSISRLPDKPASYVLIEFVLIPGENCVTLTLTLNNFPDEIIRKHMELYWRTTLNLIKSFTEKLDADKV